MGDISSRRYFLRISSYVISGIVIDSVFPYNAIGQDWLKRLKKKTKEVTDRVKEKGKEVKDDLETKVKEGSEKVEGYAEEKSKEISEKGRDYYLEHQDEIKYKVEYELEQLAQDPTRILEYKSRINNFVSESAINAISNISLEDNGRKVTLGEIANDRSIMGNNPVELGVNLSLFLITCDPYYVINNIKMIKKSDGSYVSINGAISDIYRTSKVKGSKALNFVSILNDVNKEEPTTIKGSIDYYSQRAKEIFDGWFK